jgi:hypothetical protein
MSIVKPGISPVSLSNGEYYERQRYDLHTINLPLKSRTLPVYGEGSFV